MGYNFIATVWHNPTNMLDTVGLNSNVTFSANDIGASYAIRYQTIELDSRTRDKSGKFETGSAATDYKAGRLSKIITDARWLASRFTAAAPARWGFITIPCSKRV